MSTKARNLVTGVVVLTGLFAFLWMLLKFTGRATSAFANKGVTISIRADRGDGVSDGSLVNFRGVQVGKVTLVKRAPDNAHVIITAEIDAQPPLPKNLRAVVRTQSMLGTGAAVELDITGEPEGQLAAGQELTASFMGMQIIPPELTEFITDFRRQKLIEHTDDMIVQLRMQLEKFGPVVSSVQDLIGDPKVQSDLKQSIDHIRSVTERADRIGVNLEKFSTDLQDVTHNATDTLASARKTVDNAKTAIDKVGGRVDILARHLDDDMEKLGKALDQFQAVAAKIDHGGGTAGRLLNDPRLYDQLTDTAKELTAVAASLHRLIDQWEHEGLPLKLK